MSKPIDLTGQRFGKLTVLQECYRKKNVYWSCACDCGNKTIVMGASLRNGHTISCGCARFDGAIKTAKKMLSENPKLTSAKHVYSKGYKDGNLTLEQFLYLTQRPCYYCGTNPEASNVYNRYERKSKTTVLANIVDGNFHYNGLDRVDNSKPHDLDNVVPCCKWCNSAKMNRSSLEFEEWIRKAYRTLENRNDNW